MLQKQDQLLNSKAFEISELESESLMKMSNLGTEGY